MGLVYVSIHVPQVDGIHVGKYVMAMDPIGDTVDGSEISNNHRGCIETIKIMGYTTNITWWKPDFFHQQYQHYSNWKVDG